MNVCRDNLADLPALVTEVERRGWAAHPLFQIYAAPIQPTGGFRDNGRLFTSIQLNQRLRELRETDPRVRVIATGDDSMRQRALSLFRNPEVDPIREFKASFCGAHAAMYVFDPFGDIYACWERMGDPAIRIGTVGNEGKLLFEAPMLHKWRSRTVASNPACQRCPYGLHCGGGCAILAEAANHEYSSNYCDAFAARFKKTVADAYEEFLTSENGSVQAGEMSPRTFPEMRAGCS